MRPVTAPPDEPRPRLRTLLRDKILASSDILLGAAAMVHPTAAGAAGEALRARALGRWMDLRPWTIAADLELLEERGWVEGIEDLRRWPEITGVDDQGRYEAAFREAFELHSRRARVIVDAGAARGLYTLLGARAGARVHAFEPDAGRRFALRLNVLRAGFARRVTIRPSLLGSQDGAGTFSLDGYCAREGIAPDLVKMDIEGGEIDVLEGARVVCLNHRPVLLIEFHQRRLRKQGRDPRRLLDLLAFYGYELTFNGHHGALEEGRRAADMEWRREPPNENLTAVLATRR